MSHRPGVALLGAALALTTAPATASHAEGTSCGPDRSRVWRLRRQGSAPRAIDATVNYRVLSQRNSLVVFALQRVRDRYTIRRRWETGGSTGDPYPHVYGGSLPTPMPDRPNVIEAACGRPASPTDLLPWVKYKANDFDWFVATVNTDVTITLNSPGWTITELPASSGAALRIVRSGDAPGRSTGVEAAHYGVEHFNGAQADGGRYGSHASAWLPCGPDPITATRPTGWGAAVLLGGDHADARRYLRCDGFDIFGEDEAHGRPTRWNLYGEAVGSSSVLNRLVVFDYPKP